MGKKKKLPSVLNRYKEEASSLASHLELSVKRSQAWHEIKHSEPSVIPEHETRDSTKFHLLSGGMTNTCYRVSTQNGLFFVRIPGKGSEEHLSRRDEAYNLSIIKQLGLNIDIHYINPHSGLYAGEFIDKAQNPNSLESHETLSKIVKIFKKLHTSEQLFINNIEIFDRLTGLLKNIDKHGHPLLHDRKELNERLKLLRQICKQDTSELVPCHNDPTYLNFLMNDENLWLTDWEYSGNNHAMFDLANFALTSKLSKTAQNTLLQLYYGQSPTDQVWQVFKAYKQLTNLWWYLWAELQIANKSNVVPLKDLIQTAHENWHKVMGSELPHFLREPKYKAKANTKDCSIKPNKFG